MKSKKKMKGAWKQERERNKNLPIRKTSYHTRTKKMEWNTYKKKIIGADWEDQNFLSNPSLVLGLVFFFFVMMSAENKVISASAQRNKKNNSTPSSILHLWRYTTMEMYTESDISGNK